jgi:diamine N-acetyltransferase
MASISLTEVNRENWRDTLRLSVRADQQRFTADYAPIAAIALAKAYIRPGGLVWTPYAICADGRMIGFVELAYQPGSEHDYWVYHFFIDQAEQGKGYGKAALRAFLQLVKDLHPACRSIRLTVHPENAAAQRLYTGAGFRPMGEAIEGEPVYKLDVG